MIFSTVLAAAAVCSPYEMPTVIIDELGGVICHQPPPPGPGLAANGKGAIHFLMPGFYTFIGGKVNNMTTRYYREGDWGAVSATSSRLEWIRPDGVREIVPKQLLYPPF